MRLTTLARKINITPKKLIAFLEEQGIEIENGLYGKLEKDTADMVLQHFAPEDVIEESEPDAAETEPVEIDKPVQDEAPQSDTAEVEEEANSEAESKEKEISLKDVKTEKTSPNEGTVEDLESEEFENIDLIRAKKVKLEGIKVVGKIELPEKPKKEPTESSDEEKVVEQDKKEPKTEKADSKGRNFNRRRKKNRHAINRTPLTYQEKLKEEEREKLKKRRRRENAEKRRKTKYYQEHIQPKTNQKSKKKKSDRNTDIDRPSQKNEIEVHKNPVKRFWAWLNGKYDKY